MLDVGSYHDYVSKTYYDNKAWIYNGSITSNETTLFYVCRLREPGTYQSCVLFQKFDLLTFVWKSYPFILPIITCENKGVDTGPQDCRIFIFMKHVWVVFNMLCKDGYRRMHLYCISVTNGGNAKKLRIHDEDWCKVEKNWTPFVFNGNLMFIYSFFPLIVLKCDHETGNCEVVYANHHSQPANKTMAYRGGSPAYFDEQKQAFVGWLHTTCPKKQSYDMSKLPIPARKSTNNEYRTRKFYLTWTGQTEPTLVISRKEIVFFGRQVEQVYGYLPKQKKILVNIDDSITILMDEPEPEE